MIRRRLGFSLLEVLIALALTGLILLLAVRLLGEVQTSFVQWRRTLPDPVPQLAIQLLRTDIQRSRGTGSAPGNGPLRLEQEDGSSVTYDEVLGRLVRSVEAADGTADGQRTLITGVRAWSWHNSLAPGLLEVQIVYQRHRDPGHRRLGGVGRLRDDGPVLENLTLRFTQRARPGRRIW